ncbi:hypothetical protein CHARACLAT_027549 [Characodon lateralis]|uniref:Uncharacterized protein n=1 Tax=Characodon lateralis TaxID=208331 RepID=A0ABU7DD71_9TELE|nr:hypothetical protein [Characodon lateralis]
MHVRLIFGSMTLTVGSVKFRMHLPHSTACKSEYYSNITHPKPTDGNVNFQNFLKLINNSFSKKDWKQQDKSNHIGVNYFQSAPPQLQTRSEHMKTEYLNEVK